jgi:hypothetical protein
MVRMRQISTSNDAIDAVGGTRKFARWWGSSDATVSAWRSRGFPARTFCPMQERLREDHNINVTPTAWGMRHD